MINFFSVNQDENGMNKGIFRVMSFIVFISALLGITAVFFPSAFDVIIRILWVFLLFVVTVFLILGILVIFGLRKEVSRALDVMLEGSLTIIDFVEIVKTIWQKFLNLLSEFILFVTPVLAASVSIFIYFFLIILYKTIGNENDVTILTAIITIGLVVALGLLNKPKTSATNEDIWTWLNRFRTTFKRYFADSFEIVIFVFFLTMDSTNLFFLAPELNVPLKAQFQDYNLMVKGLDVEHEIRATINLVALAIGVEIFRYILKIVGNAIDFYHDEDAYEKRSDAAKDAIRRSFANSKDDVVKFITFTTVLIAVFLLFPRLKLFAMLLASLTSLVLDVVIPARIHNKSGNDLISRIIVRVFRL